MSENNHPLYSLDTKTDKVTNVDNEQHADRLAASLKRMLECEWCEGGYRDNPEQLRYVHALIEMGCNGELRMSQADINRAFAAVERVSCVCHKDARAVLAEYRKKEG